MSTYKGSQLWKYSCYYDNPQFWSNPGKMDEVLRWVGYNNGMPRGVRSPVYIETVKTQPLPNQFEMYNLTEDPLEVINLAHPCHKTPETRAIERQLAELLAQQCSSKRLAPQSGSVPGMPACDACSKT